MPIGPHQKKALEKKQREEEAAALPKPEPLRGTIAIVDLAPTGGEPLRGVLRIGHKIIGSSLRPGEPVPAVDEENLAPEYRAALAIASK